MRRLTNQIGKEVATSTLCSWIYLSSPYPKLGKIMISACHLEAMHQVSAGGKAVLTGVGPNG